MTSGHFLEQDIAHFDHNFFGLSAEVAKVRVDFRIASRHLIAGEC